MTLQRFDLILSIITKINRHLLIYKRNSIQRLLYHIPTSRALPLIQRSRSTKSTASTTLCPTISCAVPAGTVSPRRKHIGNTAAALKVTTGYSRVLSDSSTIERALGSLSVPRLPLCLFEWITGQSIRPSKMISFRLQLSAHTLTSSGYCISFYERNDGSSVSKVSPMKP